MPRNLVTAILRSSSGQAVVDADAGIIRGVKLMELGKLARFAGDNGPKQVTISDAHIAALLSHAGNRSIPIHNTHDWFDAQDKPNADTVEMAARIGALKSFRRDEGGNLIADAYLNKAKTAALDLLWGAESNPEDNCFSVVFSYLKDDPQCIPQNFRAGDLVPSGAATTALFSEYQTQTQKSMDISELIAALADEKVQAAVKAIIKSHGDDKAAAAAPAEDTSAAEMEADAGVTDEDKKPEDDQKPALMRAALRAGRAIVRRSKQAAEETKAALLAEAKTHAEASATALLGKGGILKQSTGEPQADSYTAKLAEYRKSAPSDTVAAFRLLKDHPEFLQAHEEATRLRVAKLTPQP